LHERTSLYDILLDTSVCRIPIDEQTKTGISFLKNEELIIINVLRTQSSKNALHNEIKYEKIFCIIYYRSVIFLILIKFVLLATVFFSILRNF